MKETDVRERAFAMPFTNPAYCRALTALQSGVPDYYLSYRPREVARPGAGAAAVDEPIVKYEFIRMPDSTGFGDYTESGQVIPVSFRGRKAPTPTACS